ncbi:DUF6801 domain-containing protein [Amycolatopsis sp. NPDC052450]|uniref:DUF6801 domain-containing protein n=1 Tax=Amycolatopsis sp. NPDC052450 TaxID=3363937 RepID=UPI0037C60DB6
MGQQVRRIGAVSAIVLGAASLLAAAPAMADTSFATGAITYLCGTPFGQQPLEVRMSFTGPASVTAGGTITPTGIAGSLVFDERLNLVLYASNRDGLRGTVSTPVAGTNVAPASAAVTNLRIPEQVPPYVPGPRTVQFIQDANTLVPTFGTSTPGQAVIALGPTLRIDGEFHMRDGSWSPWTGNCTVKNTNPAQNRAFAPAIPIG